MWLDDGLRAILEAVEARGDAGNTLIAFTTDHLARGRMTLQRQYVPLLMRWPRYLAAGVDRSELVSHVDITATLLDLAGILDQATEIGVGVDGKSFASVVKDESTTWQNEIYGEVCFARSIFTEKYNYIAVRHPENFQRYPRGNTDISQEGLPSETIRFNAQYSFPGYFDPDQLYDHENDPSEQINLANEPQHRATFYSLKEKLALKLELFPYSFGELRSFVDTELAEENLLPNWKLHRGEENPIYVYEKSQHLYFGDLGDTSSWPVDVAQDTPYRNDAILYTSEERWAEGLDECIPQLGLSHNADGHLCLNITTSDRFKPHESTDTLPFIDVYVNGSWLKRLGKNDFNDHQAHVTLPDAERIRIVSFIPYYG